MTATCWEPTLLGRPGLYLEDLYVRPAFLGRGFGRRLLVHLARIAAHRRSGAVPMDEWTVYRLTGDTLKRLAEEGER